jgi:glycerophosphoryl diester phosphodiesterase
VGLRLDTVTTSLVTALHARGLLVFTYTANTPAEIEKMKWLGVDGIISNFPDLV